MQFLSSNRSRTRSRRAGYVHTVLNLILPVGVLLFVLAKAPYLAAALILLSKWRVFAVQPRYWLANVRSNSVDTIFGLSTVLLISSTGRLDIQIIFALIYAIWLLYVKPKSDTVWVSIQAIAAQTIGLAAVQDFVANESQQVWPELAVVFVSFLIALSCARHFLSSYEDRYLSALSFAWALFIAELIWILDHWVTFYTRYIAHVTILSVIFSYVVARLYDKAHNESLTHREIRNMTIFSCVILLVVVLLSNWRRSLY